jgi:hypothetical protein
MFKNKKTMTMCHHLFCGGVATKKTICCRHLLLCVREEENNNNVSPFLFVVVLHR